MKKYLVHFFTLFFFLSPVYADERFDHFIKEIRCVVCQNQSLADSHALLAEDLRQKIHAMMINRKTDEEIKAYLVSRYGEFILLNPRVNKTTLVLWLFPFAGLLGVFFTLWGFLRSS